MNAIDYGGGPDQSNELIQGQLRQIGMDVKIKAQARPPWYEDNYHCANNGLELFLRSGELDVWYAAFGSANVGGNFNRARFYFQECRRRTRGQRDLYPIG